MTKVCVELSNFVIFSGVAALGMLVWDHPSYNGSYLSHMKELCSEVWQSVCNGDEQTAVKANDSRAKSSNDWNKRTGEIVNKNAECAPRAAIEGKHNSLRISRS